MNSPAPSADGGAPAGPVARSSDAPAPRPDKAPASLTRSWRGFVYGIALAGLVALLNAHTINVSLPVIARHFHVEPGVAARVTLAYMATLTCLLLVFGKLGDQVGLKRIFVFGYGLFLVGSLASGLAPAFGLLVAARCLQGAGGSMLSAAGTALVARHVPLAIKGWAFGIQGAFSSAGVMLGAPLGGAVAQWLDWRWVFLLNVPVAALGLGLAWRGVPADPPRQPWRKILPGFDWLGALLSAGGLLALLLVLNVGRARGWGSPLTLGGLAATVVLLGLFAARERRGANPLLDPALFGHPGFALANLATLAAMVTLTGHNFLMPFYLTLRNGLDAAQTGLALMLFSGAFLLVSPLAGRLADRVNPARLSSVGMVGAALATAGFGLGMSAPGLAVPLAFMPLLGLFYALFTAPNNTLAMSLAPGAHAGAASGMLRAANSGGSAVGLALFGAIYATFAVPAGPAAAVSLLAGFRWAYLVGGGCCMVACLASLLAGRPARHRG